MEQQYRVHMTTTCICIDKDKQNETAQSSGAIRLGHDLYLTRLKVGVQKLSTVHVPDAPVGVVRRLPVVLGLADQPPQLVLLVPLGLATGGQLRLKFTIWEHLVLHQNCTTRKGLSHAEAR